MSKNWVREASEKSARVTHARVDQPTRFDLNKLGCGLLTGLTCEVRRESAVRGEWGVGQESA